MTVRVMLVSPAVNADLRQARFGDDSPLDGAGSLQARAAAGGLPRSDRLMRAGTRRCRETAGALGLGAAEAVPALGDLDAGRWRGRSLAEVAEAEPGAVAEWLANPEAAPHGGESVAGLIGRVGDWLAGCTDGRVLAVAEPAAVRAAVVHALGLPPQVFWRLDVPPLTLTELTGGAGRWNLRCGRPLASGLPEPRT
ncbi:histidine phosphatase family protein [Streptomyces sp. NPDC050610]|uniref:histidine phosphatase family protein n=1 Tax=Streptomyces sp. NPDC050610 TaxID=3157097 RepID=UPI00343BFCE8